MLDVHPPHQAAHTWKDFLIHIATIVIGLLIAIGLEQTVEWFHHRRQVAETHNALHEEREHNQHDFALATQHWRLETIRFQTNLAVLVYVQHHPGAPSAEWPGQINWHSDNSVFPDAAWETAQHDNITALMPQKEVRADQILYRSLSIIGEDYRERIRIVGIERQSMVQDSDPSHLSPADLADDVARARAVLVAHYRVGADMRNLNGSFPDFAPAPSTMELNDIMHEPHTDAYLHPFGLSPGPSQAKPDPPAK